MILVAVAAIDYRYLTSSHWYIYAGVVASLVLVAVAGQLGNEARRWIQITPTLRIQPSEFGRILLTITFAQFLANRQHLMGRFSNTLITLVYIGIPIGLIFIQPDLGMSILFIAIWFVMIWLAGLPLSHFAVLAAVGILGIGLVYPFLADYQKQRVTTFLNPEEANEDDIFNIEQAEISIGSGGFWGKGYMQGTQSQLGFLRVQHTDFIFSMITEEMGLIFGSLIVVILLGFIITAHPARGAAQPGFCRQAYCRGHCYHSLFPDRSQYRHECSPAAGDRPDAALCQLWRQFLGHLVPGHRPCSIRAHAPAQTGFRLIGWLNLNPVYSL